MIKSCYNNGKLLPAARPRGTRAGLQPLVAAFNPSLRGGPCLSAAHFRRAHPRALGTGHSRKAL